MRVHISQANEIEPLMKSELAIGIPISASVDENAWNTQDKEEQKQNGEVFEHFEIQIDSNAERFQLASSPSLV